MKTVLAEARQVPLARQVEEVVLETPVIDIHTHLYEPTFKELLLWGIDELLIYHYLIAETFRYLEEPYESFWARSKAAQAELVWEHLFLKHSPISDTAMWCHYWLRSRRHSRSYWNG